MGLGQQAFRLSKKSKQNLAGVSIDLVSVVKRAIKITEVDFMVGEGVRTPARQAAYFAEGKSRTLKSKHLIGEAVDLFAWVNGRVSWDWRYYELIAKAMKAAANELGIYIIWGGDWENFRDGVHFELIDRGLNVQRD